MTDFGVTASLLKHFQSHPFLGQKAQGIYGAVPVNAVPPYLHLDPLSVLRGFGSRSGRVDYKITVVSAYHGSKEIHLFLDELKKSLEGKKLRTSEGMAYFRLEKVLLSETPDHTTRQGQCYFSILVRFYQKKGDA